MSAVGWGLIAFGAWAILCTFLFLFLAGATGKPEPRSDFSLWEQESSSGGETD